MTAAASEPGGTNFLGFTVGAETFNLPGTSIAEIIRRPAVTRVPHGPPSLLGVANLRGAVLPVVSLAVLLGLNAEPAGPRARVLVMAGNSPIGLLVDSVASLNNRIDGRLLDVTDLLARDFGPLMHRTGSRASLATAQRADTQEQGARQDELVLIGLRLAEQEYALPLEKVAEVVRMPATLTKVPHTDSAMIGVTALRDRLLPLVSLRVLLGMPRDGSAAGSTRIVVARLGSMTVGLVVDAVTSALRVNSGSIDPVPPVLTRGKGEAQLEGICRVDGGRRLVCLLSTARLLDSQTMALIQMQIQQESAVMASAETQNDATEQFLIFRLGEEEYGLPIQAVDEVARRPDALVRLPRAPAFVEGVMNLRGRVIPVISQRKRFAVTDDGARSRRVVVVTVDGLQAGFAVDDVSEVVRVPAADLLAAPDIEAPGGMVFDRVLTRPDGRMILLISPRALLDQAERDLLASIATDEPAAVA